MRHAPEPAVPGWDRYWVVIALFALAAVVVSLELGARIALRRVSTIEHRIAAARIATVALKHGRTRPSILFAGNSLLLHGLDCEHLRRSLDGSADVRCLAIEQTQYVDWYYGLRRLTREGAAPDMIILCLNGRQLTSSAARSDYSSYYLFDTGDLFAISQELHYRLGKAADLAFAHFSFFYASRMNVRNFVLQSLAPRYSMILHELALSARQDTNPPPAGLMFARLRALNELCTSRGSRFLLLLPPGFGSEEDAVKNAGMRAGTTVLVPVPLNTLPQADFSDGFHLNAEGRQVFTNQVSRALAGYIRRAHDRMVEENRKNTASTPLPSMGAALSFPRAEIQ